MRHRNEHTHRTEGAVNSQFVGGSLSIIGLDPDNRLDSEIINRPDLTALRLSPLYFHPQNNFLWGTFTNHLSGSFMVVVAERISPAGGVTRMGDLLVVAEV